MQHLEDIIPPSSIVPSTGQRSGYRNPMDLNTSPAIDTVGNTPTKRTSAPSFIRRQNDEPAIPPSPLAGTSNTVGRPLSANERMVNRLQLPRVHEESENQTSQSRDNIFATPAKKQQQILSASPVGQLQLQGQNKPQKSIYETLGWDDDYDI